MYLMIFPDEQVLVVNLELDIPPGMKELTTGSKVHTVGKNTMAEAQYLAQQRKYWPSGLF